MDLFGLNGYSGLYGLNSIYGLKGASGSPSEMASLYPAASYAKFSDALQKAAGGQQDMEKVFDRMQEDPAYKKEVLDLLQKGFLDRRVELYEQSCGQMSLRRGGSLADRLAANRSGRISERDGSKHLK